MSGGVIIARNLWDDPAFQNEPFSEREAWIWMICEAAWKPREKRVGKVIAQLDRGQLAVSIRFMAEAFSWHRNKADRFLKRLEKCNLIRVESGTGVNVITLCKYNEYQLSPKSFGTEAGQKRDRSGTNDKKGEIREEGKDRDTNVSLALIASKSKPPDLFSEFWDRYPKRIGKADAHKAYAKAVKKIPHDDLMFALSERLPALEAKDKQYRPNPATWLNQERWTDDIEAGSDTGRSRAGGSNNAMVNAFAAVAAARVARNARN